jgi:cytochrome c peroxidase
MSKMRLAAATIAPLFAISFAFAADDASVMKEAQKIFRPLPADTASPEGPATPERMELGRKLFFDPRLTVDSNISCATCHQPALYGADPLPKSIGVKQRVLLRNTPTILNSALNFINNWRGDRESVERQAEHALTAPLSSGQPSDAAVIDRLERISGYAPLFEAAFPNEPHPMTAGNIAKAIGAYERTLATPSPFDVYLGGKVDALSQQQRAGLDKFINIGCASCHSGAGIGGGMYAKFGVVADYWTATGSKNVDKGRFDVTKDPADMHVFRVASLRNVAMTPPYFHDGSVASLPEAMRVMAKIQLGVDLSDQDTHDIVAFLNSLTGKLPDQFAIAPILPPGAP